MLKLIEKKRARRVFVRRVILGMGLIIVALLSPYLIRGAALISGGLTVLLEVSGAFMTSPRGIACAAFCILLLFIFKRRLVSTLI